MNARIGCAYCFETLDPEDDRVGRTFVRCFNCGAAYHSSCQASLPECLRCKGELYLPLEIEPPTPLAGGTQSSGVSDITIPKADHSYFGIVIPARVVPYLPYLAGVSVVLFMVCGWLTAAGAFLLLLQR